MCDLHVQPRIHSLYYNKRDDIKVLTISTGIGNGGLGGLKPPDF